MTRILLVFLILCFATSPAMGAKKEKDREAKQAQLDGECEVARQKKLIPEREKYTEECVEKKQRPDRASCERFYADYGNQSGNRAPLYYDLPECAKAHEYRQSYRS